MVVRPTLLRLALLLTVFPCMAEDGVEDATTPLTLAKLLPPEGLEAIEAEFWLPTDADKQAAELAEDPAAGE